MDLNDIARVLTELREAVTDLNVAILGNLKDHDKPGILTRLDRTEQTIKNVRRGVWLIAGSLITLATSLIIKAVTC
ncbi:MAG: hypothetical protein WC942_09665 [Clostridia bacterium]|jgi:hypothetical protein